MAGIALDCDVLVSQPGSKVFTKLSGPGWKGDGEALGAGLWMLDVLAERWAPQLGGGACDPVGPGVAEEGQGPGCWGGGGVEGKLRPSL